MNPLFISPGAARRWLATLALGACAGLSTIAQAQTLDSVPGKRSDTFELARAAAKATERQEKLAKLEADGQVAHDPKAPDARPADPKAGDAKKPAAKPTSVERMNDGTVRLRPSADPQKAIDAIRERLSDRGVEKRIDADGNALLRVGSAEAKPVGGNRLVMASATMTSTARKPVAGAAGGERAKGDDAHPTAAKPKAAASATRPDAARGTAHAAPHWSYDGDHSPEQWARLSPEWATCAKGTRQSPIDIHEGIKVDLESIRFEYRPSAFTVVDNGHTIQVNLPPGNAITVAGKRYELLQFHFHKPAEERVDGKPFDMVVHLVHKDANGKLAVVAVLLEKGSAQEVVQNVWNHLPLEKGDAVEAGVPLDPNALLPTERGYYTYMGSLTTPPCSEGVLWMVMKQPLGVSPDQLAIFARLYPMNARPLQADSSRLIKESN